MPSLVGSEMCIRDSPGSMEEECEYGLTSGTCFTARRLEVVAVAGLLWIYFVLCFFSVWWDFVFFFRFLYFERTRPIASTRQPCLMYLSTSMDYGSCTSPITQNRYIWKRTSTGYRVGRGFSPAISRWSWSPGCCGFRGVFSVRRDHFQFRPVEHNRWLRETQTAVSVH